MKDTIYIPFGGVIVTATTILQGLFGGVSDSGFLPNPGRDGWED